MVGGGFGRVGEGSGGEGLGRRGGGGRWKGVRTLSSLLPLRTESEVVSVLISSSACLGGSAAVIYRQFRVKGHCLELAQSTLHQLDRA